MPYFKIIAAAAAVTTTALTVMFCGMYGLFVRYHAIVPSVVVFYCLNENE